MVKSHFLTRYGLIALIAVFSTVSAMAQESVQKNRIQQDAETEKSETVRVEPLTSAAQVVPVTAQTSNSFGDRASLPANLDPRIARSAWIARGASDAALLLDPEQTATQNDPQPGPTPRVPLTGEEKIERAFNSAFLNPAGYATTAFGAAITEWTEEDLPHKTTEDRIGDFGTRWAIRFSTRATNTLLGSGVFPVLFKQDPRYERAGNKNVVRRALHAVSRVFVTRDDDGNLEPNVSRWAGSLSSSALSNLWEQSTPGRDRIGADATFRRFASSFSGGAINNIIREFLPDLLKKFGR